MFYRDGVNAENNYAQHDLYLCYVLIGYCVLVDDRTFYT
jgi:hypothetical protein